jgi:hypothetical protein
LRPGGVLFSAGRRSSPTLRSSVYAAW